MEERHRGVGLALAEFILKQRGREFTESAALRALPEFKREAVSYRIGRLVSRGELQKIARKGTTFYSSKGDRSGIESGNFRCSPLLLHAMGKIARKRSDGNGSAPASAPCPLWRPEASPEEIRRWARELIENAGG